MSFTAQTIHFRLLILLCTCYCLMEIINFDLNKVKDKPYHHWLLPSSIRCVICGPSGCGKTNLMLNLLPNKGYLNFDRLHLYSRSLGQEKY